MNVGIMEDIRRKHLREFINVIDFLCYIAYTQNESVKDVVSWLYYHNFDEDVTSCHTDKHCRLLACESDDGIDICIDNLFEQISIGGYQNYYLYLEEVENKDEYELDGYTVVDNQFGFDIKELQELDYIKELNIDISNAPFYSYTIYIDDKVSVKPITEEKRRLFHIFGAQPCSLEESIKKTKKLTLEQEEANQQQLKIIEENIRKVIEWAASSDSTEAADEKPPKDIAEDIKKLITDKEEYERLTPIQKYTFYMKNIVLPLAQKIWFHDKETNLLMRKQVARLVVELLPDFDLTENQVDDWLKNSDLVPQAIIDRCAQHDYGNTKPEKIKREVIEHKIRSKIAPEIQSLIENTPKF